MTDKEQWRAVLDRIAELEAHQASLAEALEATSGRLQRLEAAVAESASLVDKRLSRQAARHDKHVRVMDQRVESMRLHHQVLALPRWVANRARPPKPPRLRVAVVCPTYPMGSTNYGGEFIRARVTLYRRFGLEPTVIVANPDEEVVNVATVDEVRVVRVDAEGLARELDIASPEAVFVHHMGPYVWPTLRTVAKKVPMVVWVHGFEARDWRELAGNFDQGYVESRLKYLETLNERRRATMDPVFADPNIGKVFVSQFMRGVAETFVGREAANARVIPNVVNEEVFPYKPRRPESRFRILWVRSFTKRNYANDQSRDAVLHLAAHPTFDRMQVTIVGDGEYFEESTAPLAHLPNVTIDQRFVDHRELARLHESHGIMLVPTRWDSQGLTCCEAMSSGLVPVTTRTTAVPEFVPDDAGMLCPPEDPRALADAILHLQAQPDIFLSMSRAAAKAARACHIDHTVRREAELVRPPWWQRLYTSPTDPGSLVSRLAARGRR